MLLNVGVLMLGFHAAPFGLRTLETRIRRKAFHLKQRVAKRRSFRVFGCPSQGARLLQIMDRVMAVVMALQWFPQPVELAPCGTRRTTCW